MKKLVLLICLFVVTTSFTTEKSIQQQPVKSYINHQGQWYEGYITFVTDQFGKTVVSTYTFPTLFTANGTAFKGYFTGYENFTPLNPNSELAKQYNFTHYISFQGVNAYVTLQ